MIRGGLGKLDRMVGNGSRFKNAELTAQYFMVVTMQVKIQTLQRHI